MTAAYILWKIIQFMFLGPFNEERWGGLTDMVTVREGHPVAAGAVHGLLRRLPDADREPVQHGDDGVASANCNGRAQTARWRFALGLGQLS